MSYSNSESVSAYVFGITNNLYSIYGNIKVTQCQVGREEDNACARCMDGEAKASRVAGLNQYQQLVPSIYQGKRCSSCSS